MSGVSSPSSLNSGEDESEFEARRCLKIHANQETVANLFFIRCFRSTRPFKITISENSYFREHEKRQEKSLFFEWSFEVDIISLMSPYRPLRYQLILSLVKFRTLLRIDH